MCLDTESSATHSTVRTTLVWSNQTLESRTPAIITHRIADLQCRVAKPVTATQVAPTSQRSRQPRPTGMKTFHTVPTEGPPASLYTLHEMAFGYLRQFFFFSHFLFERNSTNLTIVSHLMWFWLWACRLLVGFSTLHACLSLLSVVSFFFIP